MTAAPPATPPVPPAPHRIVEVNYGIRTTAFAYAFFVMGVLGWERDAGLVYWALLVLQFLVYPHLAWLHARRAADPRAAEVANLYVDAGLFGAWIAALGFPTWPAYGLLSAAALNASTWRGVQGAFWALACFAGGAALWVAGMGYQYWPTTTSLVSTLCFFGSFAYTCAVGYVLHRNSRRLAQARDELRESEHRYRLISENAADLVGMVDTDCRWVYASPSYERILHPDELLAGVDSLRCVHPDDADRTRVAVLRCAATGRPRELAIRLVDREGRIRQYRMRISAVDDQGGRHVLLVSRDVTDLRDSEERLLLAAQALEGMTEAIMIASADGTVVTVNRAFCQITGYERDDVVGLPETAIRHALQPARFYEDLYAAVRNKGYWTGTTWSRRRDGTVYREWRSVRAVRDQTGTITHYVTVFYEVDAPGHRVRADLAS